MLSQKFPRTWQIYLPLTYHSSLLEASINNSSSKLPDPQVGEVVVEEGLQPPLHQQELPYFNQARNCAPAALQNLEKLASRLFSVYMSTAGDGFQGDSFPPATWCVSLSKRAGEGIVLHFPPVPLVCDNQHTGPWKGALSSYIHLWLEPVTAVFLSGK